MYWEVVGGLSIRANFNPLTLTPITPKIWDPKTPPLNYSQTAANGATDVGSKLLQAAAFSGKTSNGVLSYVLTFVRRRRSSSITK